MTEMRSPDTGEIPVVGIPAVPVDVSDTPDTPDTADTADTADTVGRSGRRRSGGEPGAAFDDHVRATAHLLHRTALLLTGGDHHLAEDLVQTTYAKVYASWRRVEAADEPVAYTRTMLTRTFLSHRRLRRSTERPTDTIPDRVAADAGASAEQSAERLDLMAALASLSARDRAVVVQRYWLDRSVAEVAADLGLTQTTVKTRSRRALGRLRERLDVDLPHDPNEAAR